MTIFIYRSNVKDGLPVKNVTMLQKYGSQKKFWKIFLFYGGL